MKNALIIFALTLFTIANAKAAEKGIVGTWEFEADAAPYGFQTGTAEFYESDKTLMVKLVFEYDELTDIKVNKKDNSYIFEVEVEYQLVPVTLKLANNKLEGTAESPEGDIAVVMKKKK